MRPPDNLGLRHGLSSNNMARIASDYGGARSAAPRHPERRSQCKSYKTAAPQTKSRLSGSKNSGRLVIKQMQASSKCFSGSANSAFCGARSDQIIISDDQTVSSQHGLSSSNMARIISDYGGSRSAAPRAGHRIRRARPRRRSGPAACVTHTQSEVVSRAIWCPSCWRIVHVRVAPGTQSTPVHDSRPTT